MPTNRLHKADACKFGETKERQKTSPGRTEAPRFLLFLLLLSLNCCASAADLTGPFGAPLGNGCAVCHGDFFPAPKSDTLTLVEACCPAALPPSFSGASAADPVSCNLMLPKVSWFDGLHLTPMGAVIICIALLGEAFQRFVTVGVLYWRKSRVTSCDVNVHRKTRPKSSPSWYTLSRAKGPWRAAFTQFHNQSFLVPARTVGGKRVKGVRGLLGLGRCWRKTPRSCQSKQSKVAVDRCLQYLVLKLQRDQKRKQLMSLRADLRGGAGGKATKARKRAENQSLADALSGFLEAWIDQKTTEERPQKRRFTGDTGWNPSLNSGKKQNGDDQSLARQLIDVLKKCLNAGSSDDEVAAEVLQMLKPRQKPRSKQKHSESWEQYQQYEYDGWDDSWQNGDWDNSWYSNWDHGARQSVDLKIPEKSSQPPKSAPAHFIDDSQWTGQPKLTSVAAVREALTQGHDLPGNLLVTSDPADLHSMKNLWNAFDIAKAFTAALATVEPAKGPMVSIGGKKDQNMEPDRLDKRFCCTSLVLKRAPRLLLPKQLNFHKKRVRQW